MAVAMSRRVETNAAPGGTDGGLLHLVHHLHFNELVAERA